MDQILQSKEKGAKWIKKKKKKKKRLSVCCLQETSDAITYAD